MHRVHVLAGKEQKPDGRTEDQDQAYAEKSTEQASGSDIHQPARAAGDDG